MVATKYYKNPSLLTQRNNELNEYRKIGKFTDLTLKSTDGETMTVNKNILSAACPYFKGMFNSELIESRQDEIQLVDDVTIADLNVLIEYFYTGEAKVELDNAENLYIKAQYLQLAELKQFCSEYLIENITIENCLAYWRNSVKYLNDKLEVECLKFIKENCKSFLETKAMDLTAEEFKLIISEKNLLIDQKELYTFATTWIKEDIESRNVYLMEFIKKLDFTEISAEFIENEIMSDKILHNNQEFSSKIISTTFEKLRDVKKELNMYSKRMNLVSSSGIYMLNWSAWKWIKQFNIEEENKFFATAVLQNDIFISGGWNKQTKKRISNFESWNISSRKSKQLPQMLKARCKHKLVYFKEISYCCGGDNNKGSIEIFDLKNLKWNNGPTMNDSKNSFSLINSDDSIYTFGGWKDADTRSNIIEQFDPREGKWKIISSDGPAISHAAVLSNKLVYCLNTIYGGKIFDLRTNKWTNSIPPVVEKNEDVEYYVNCCDVIEFNDEIFGVFQTYNSKTWGTFKYNRAKGKWADLGIPIYLNENDDITLCVASQS